jgi:hypothetical protein
MAPQSLGIGAGTSTVTNIATCAPPARAIATAASIGARSLSAFT